MSVGTLWSLAHRELPEVVAEHTDAYGTGLDDGNVALLLGVDEFYCIEAVSVDEIRDLAERILLACDDFQRTTIASEVSR